jgi:hypothetical protein
MLRDVSFVELLVEKLTLTFFSGFDLFFCHPKIRAILEMQSHFMVDVLHNFCRLPSYQHLHLREKLGVTYSRDILYCSCLVPCQGVCSSELDL